MTRRKIDPCGQRSDLHATLRCNGTNYVQSKAPSPHRTGAFVVRGMVIVTAPESHIYDDLEQLIADVEAQAASLRADAQAERAQAEDQSKTKAERQEHEGAAAKLDWHASQCERAIAMYHDSVAQLRHHRGTGTGTAAEG